VCVKGCFEQAGEIREKNRVFGWSDLGRGGGGGIPWLEVSGGGRTNIWDRQIHPGAGAGLRDPRVPSKLGINRLTHNSVLSRAFGKPVSQRAG